MNYERTSIPSTVLLLLRRRRGAITVALPTAVCKS